MSRFYRSITLAVVVAMLAITASHFALAKGKPGGGGGGGGGDTTGYAITELTPPEGFDSSYGNASNDFGEVAGDVGDGFAHAAYWKVDSAGQLLSAVALPQLFNRASRAFAISNFGDVVGGSDVGLDDEGISIFHAVLWNVDAGNVTNTTDLGTLGGDYVYSSAHGVNDFGYIVGNSTVKASSPTESSMPRAVLWMVDADGNLLKIIDLGPGEAKDINNSGQIVGEIFDPDRRAFLWQIDAEGNVVLATDLGTLGGRSFASAISELGDVIGSSETNNGEYHAFLYRNGEMVDLGTLGGDESFGGAGNGIGQVVGASMYPRSQGLYDFHAFLWENGAISDLSKAGGKQWVLTRASGIDPSGRIAGTGVLKFVGNTWKTRGYLLTPR